MPSTTVKLGDTKPKIGLDLDPQDPHKGEREYLIKIGKKIIDKCKTQNLAIDTAACKCTFVGNDVKFEWTKDDARPDVVKKIIKL